MEDILFDGASPTYLGRFVVIFVHHFFVGREDAHAFAFCSGGDLGLSCGMSNHGPSSTLNVQAYPLSQTSRDLWSALMTRYEVVGMDVVDDFFGSQTIQVTTKEEVCY